MKESFVTRLVKPLFLSNILSKEGDFNKNIFDNTINFQNLYLKTKDNCKIGCWLLKPFKLLHEPMNYVILLHGTGSNRIDFCSSFRVQDIVNLNYTILIPDYRDFGDSEGEFYVKTVNYDIDVCMDFMKKNYSENIHLIGFSLGAAVALEYTRYIQKEKINLAEDYDHTMINKCDSFRGKVVLIAPFHSTLKILNDQWLWYLATFIIPYASSKVENEFNYNSIENIKLLKKENVFLLHGKKDRMVDFSHSVELHRNFNCKFYSGEDDDHFTLMTKKDCWREISDFLNSQG
jgi:pimeloyl-ACP methyl ester carboxylesterase